MNYFLRPYLPDTDDLAALTDLLHRAYAPLRAQGMWFLASTQDVAATRTRLGQGFAFMAVYDDDATERVIGTITVYPPSEQEYCEWYRGAAWHFGQFAVEPEYQKHGIGAALIVQAEETAKKHGATQMALDTAEPAAKLIAFYERCGYKHVGFMKWESVNYRSVVMSKSLTP